MPCGDGGAAGSRRARCGFTLIELLVVLAIVGTLLSLSVPRYFKSLDNARETVLNDNLRQTREVLDKFYADSGRYPDTLEELVALRYLKALPFDPVLDSSTAWVITPPPSGRSGKVYDLHSAATGLNRFGQKLSEL